jgi:hypothetical protein
MRATARTREREREDEEDVPFPEHVGVQLQIGAAAVYRHNLPPRVSANGIWTSTTKYLNLSLSVIKHIVPLCLSLSLYLSISLTHRCATTQLTTVAQAEVRRHTGQHDDISLLHATMRQQHDTDAHRETEKDG